MRRLLANAIVLVISLGLTLFVCELLVRAIMPQQLIMIRPDIWEPADTLGWVHRPNVHTTINTGERLVRVITDREGFRVGERGRLEAPRTLLLVGDSYVEAFQVPYEQSFAGLLERRLPARLGGPVAVRAVASGGWDPNHYLFATRRWLPRDPSPLVVVCVFMGNDILDRRVDAYSPRQEIERHPLRMPRAFTRREWIRSVLLPINDALETRSHLYILVRSRLGNLRVKLGLAPMNTLPPQYLTRNAHEPDFGITADACRDLDAVARADGARTLFVLIPASYQVDAASFRRWCEATRLAPNEADADQPDRRMGEELAARGVAFIDALPGLRAAARKGGPPLYGAVDAHLSPAGHAALTNIMLPEIVARWGASPPVAAK
jgi:hypothetical protein